jgi:hypothetical protein
MSLEGRCSAVWVVIFETGRALAFVMFERVRAINDVSVGVSLLRDDSPAAARPWLTSATRPAQAGAERLVPPTTSNGLLGSRLYGSAIQAPVAGSATRETSGVVRLPVD